MTRFYTPASIKRVLRGETDPIFSLQSSAESTVESAQREYPYRLPDPTSRKDIEYYRDHAHRGYLHYQVMEGQGPSLFYRAANESNGIQRKLLKKNVSGQGSENKIW
jgi:large subunit ribosomal protein L15